MDTVLVPVSSEYPSKPASVQTDGYDEMQRICAGARMKGEVVLVWENADGSIGYIADPRMQGALKRVTRAFLQANLNREITAPQLPPFVLREVHDDLSAPEPPAPSVIAPYRTHIPTPNVAAPSFPKGSQRPSRGGEFRNYPMRLLTMVFTDTVGSTALKQRLGDQPALELKRWHDSVIREELEKSFTGREVSTAGDSFFIIFETPSEATRFALQVQSRLRAGHGGAPAVLKDRIGIHVGEVFYEDHGSPGKLHDVHGIQVDSTARLMSLADADQILMTRFAFDNAQQTFRGTKIDGIGPIHWNSYGLYALKGVDAPIEVCEVGEAGRALLRPPGNSSKAERLPRPDVV
jgi:class 3 adenylate cyclase